MTEPASSQFDDDAWEPEPEWEWRKCRNAGLAVQFWPIEWALGKYATSDAYCWVGTVHLGPFVIQLNCNVGTPTSATEGAE